MSNKSPKRFPLHRIRSLRPAGRDASIPAVPTDTRVNAAEQGGLLLSRPVRLFAKGSVAFADRIFPYLKSPFAIVYVVAAMLVSGSIMNATLSQSGRYLRDGYVLYAPFVSLHDPALSFWHYGLYFFIAPVLGVTSACIVGLALAYVSLGIGAGVVIWYAGWGSSNFYQYTLPEIIALIQGGVMATVFKQAANFIFSALIWLYVIVVAIFWTFLLLFTCATWIHWSVEWSMRSAH